MSSKKESFFSKLFDLKGIDLKSYKDTLQNSKFSLFNEDFFSIHMEVDFHKIFYLGISFLMLWGNFSQLAVYGFWYFLYSIIGFSILTSALASTRSFKSGRSEFSYFLIRAFLKLCPPQYRALRLFDLVFLGAFAYPTYVAGDYIDIFLLGASFVAFRLSYYITYKVSKKVVIEYIDEYRSKNPAT